MKPLHLRAENLRSFPTLDLTFPQGALGIVGANGAGKSTVVNAIDLALFGPESRSLEPYVSDGALPGETLKIELELEHRGERYRIRRTYTSGGRGKSSTEFALVDLGGTRTYEPLTQGDQKETQALIEQTLGLTRETFRASAMLAQGDGSAFCDAQPRERKRILADTLGLGIWDEMKKRASEDRTRRAREIDGLNGRLAFLDEQVAGAGTLQTRVADLAQHELALKLRIENAEHDLATAKTAHEKLQERAQRATTIRADLRAAVAEQSALAREQQAALDARAQAVALEQELPALRARANEQTANETERETLQEQRREQELQRERSTQLAAELETVKSSRRRADEARATATEQHTAALERIQELRDKPHAKCDRCEQDLGGQARDKAIESNQKEAAEYAARAKRAETESNDLASTETKLRERLRAAGEVVVDEGFEQRYADAMQKGRDLAGAREKLAAAAERLEGLKAQANIRDSFQDELAAAEARVRDTESALRQADEPSEQEMAAAQRAVGEATQTERIARMDADTNRVELARARTRLEAVTQAQADRAAGVAERDRLQADLDELLLLERAFGRDGVPTWILETSAIPALELEADRLLTMLGTDYRVELRTQRELKGGGAAETLDVVMLTPHGERDYQTFSGGERTRLNLALRLALARLLAHRRGTENRLLAIDEPEFLDVAGTERLVEALREMSQAGEFETVLLVSHVPSLRDAFDQTLVVSKVEGRSEVAVA